MRCSGLVIDIQIQEDYIIWDFGNEAKIKPLTFDKNQYEYVLNQILNKNESCF